MDQVVLVGYFGAIRVGENISGHENGRFAEIVVVITDRQPVALTDGVIHSAEDFVEILLIRAYESDGTVSRLDRQERQENRYCPFNHPPPLHNSRHLPLPTPHPPP